MLRTDLIAPISELLKRHAAARGEKCAYRDARTSVTYAALLDRTASLAGHLADHGIATGDTVAIYLPNSVEWVESCLAIARTGAISVPISYNSTESEIAYRLVDANCKAIITTADRGELVGATSSGRAECRHADRNGSWRLRNAGAALCRVDRGAAEIGAARSDFAS